MMKYWSELTDMEEVAIRLEEVKNLVDAIAEATDSMQHHSIQSCLYAISRQMENIDDMFGAKFMVLWNAVRDDSDLEEKQEEVKPAAMKATKKGKK
mgnify:CR=1 FL=1